MNPDSCFCVDRAFLWCTSSDNLYFPNKFCRFEILFSMDYWPSELLLVEWVREGGGGLVCWPSELWLGRSEGRDQELKTMWWLDEGHVNDWVKVKMSRYGDGTMGVRRNCGRGEILHINTIFLLAWCSVWDGWVLLWSRLFDLSGAHT